MVELSPQAQAVMIAATNGNTNVVNDPVYRQCIAAALRAVADNLTPKTLDAVRILYALIDIADELENHQ